MKSVDRLQICPIVHNYRAPRTIPQSYIWVCAVVWECGKRQTRRHWQTDTDTQTAMTNIHFASAMPNAKCSQYHPDGSKKTCSSLMANLDLSAYEVILLTSTANDRQMTSHSCLVVTMALSRLVFDKLTRFISLEKVYPLLVTIWPWWLMGVTSSMGLSMSILQWLPLKRTIFQLGAYGTDRQSGRQQFHLMQPTLVARTQNN